MMALAVTMASATPGRTRWRAPALRGDPARAMATEQRLVDLAGVRSAAVSAITGSILVIHDRGADHAAMIAAIDAAPAYTAPVSIPPPPLSLSADAIAGTAAAAVAAGASLVRILAMGRAVDGMIGTGGALLSPVTAVGLGASTLVYLEGRRASALAWRRLGAAAAREAMRRGTQALMAVDLAGADALAADNRVAAMLNDVGDVERAYESAGELVLLATNTVVLTGAFVVLAPRLGWIPLAALGAMGIVLIAGATTQEAPAEDLRALAARQTLEAFDALPTVKAHGLEARMVARIDATMARYGVREAGEAARALRDPLRLEGITMLGVATTTLVAATALAAGTMNPGRHLALMMISGHLFYPFAYTAIPIANVRKGLAARQRLAALAAIPAEVDPVSGRALDDGAPDIRFEGVSFAYPGAVRPTVRDVSFAVPAGGFVAIVGPSGSGKSTLTRLLLAFYAADAGRIAIDGKDVQTVAKAALRRAIAWVDQRAFLFDASLAENIALADPAAGRATLLEAARLAAVAEFADTLPGGYDAPIGPRGARLSDGQRQRVLLARALLKPSSLMVLDEATAALDAETERRVLANVRRHARHRTLIVIAHHLASIEAADLIVVMDEGAVVGCGTHETLRETCATYRRLLDAA